MNDPTFLDLFRNAERIVAEDKAWQQAATVPQEPWPDDGTLPIAAHVVLSTDPETGEQDILWTGESYAGTAQSLTRGIRGPLRVRPTFEMVGNEPTTHLRLIDDEGRTWAHTISMVW